MADMKLSIQERKDFCVPTIMDKAPKYPQGLKIELTSDDLKRIGFQGELIVGSKIEFEAMATIVEVSLEDSEGDENCKCVELQITDIILDTKQEDATSKMYGA